MHLRISVLVILLVSGVPGSSPTQEPASKEIPAGMARRCIAPGALSLQGVQPGQDSAVVTGQLGPARAARRDTVRSREHGYAMTRYSFRHVEVLIGDGRVYEVRARNARAVTPQGPGSMLVITWRTSRPT